MSEALRDGDLRSVVSAGHTHGIAAFCGPVEDDPAQWLAARGVLTVKAPSADGFGLFGSGMFVLNPPYTLASELKKALPYLVETLGEDA